VRVAVTGPTGKLGQRVVARLAAAGVEQLMVARDPTRLPSLPGAVPPGPAAYIDTDAMRGGAGRRGHDVADLGEPVRAAAGRALLGAGAPCAASTSSTRGVIDGLGPLSNADVIRRPPGRHAMLVFVVQAYNSL
jgi:uncharacterized protein YbjT (DUF2867 family)